MYLTVGNGEILVCEDRAGASPRRTAWDVARLAHTVPNQDGGFAAFQERRTGIPDVPIVLGALAEGIVNLPRFLKGGLRSYIIRDARGDFLFLLLSALESAVAGVQAERASKVAEVLKHELDSVRKLQETIIPKGIRCQPGYRAVARYEPAEVSVAGGKPVVMAGGDYYEVFPADGQTLVALIGDASGHGLKACMSIITMHTSST